MLITLSTTLNFTAHLKQHLTQLNCFLKFYYKHILIFKNFFTTYILRFNITFKDVKHFTFLVLIKGLLVV